MIFIQKKKKKTGHSKENSQQQKTKNEVVNEKRNKSMYTKLKTTYSKFQNKIK